MFDPSPILVAHYNAVRAEQLERIKQRDQIVILFATAVAGAIGIYAKDAAWWGLLVAIPLLAPLAALFYANTDIALGTLGRWLRAEYTEGIRKYAEAFADGLRLPHWDASTHHTSHVHGSSFRLRYFVVAAFFAGSSALACVLIRKQLTRQLPFNRDYGFWVLLMCGLSAAVPPLFARRVRLRQVDS